MSYLLDTNVISETIRSKPDKKVLDWLNQIPKEALFVSVLSLGEVRKDLENAKEISKKERLKTWLEIELVDWLGERILSIDQEVADRWGRLQAEIKRPLPAIDSLIAATALHYDFTLVTRNLKDFSYPDLQIVNPWE